MRFCGERGAQEVGDFEGGPMGYISVSVIAVGGASGDAARRWWWGHSFVNAARPTYIC